MAAGSSECDKSSSVHELKGSYWLTRVLYLRFLGFVYLTAFVIAFNQNKELIGDRGLLPIQNYMSRIYETVPNWVDRLTVAPTLFWLQAPSWNHVNSLLDAISLSGILISISIIITGAANMIALFLLWMLYFSLVSVGSTWYGFGWESMLLEVGFLSIWLVPISQWTKYPCQYPVPLLVLGGSRWFLFRVMLGAGLIKIRGDPCWRDLTCMNYFYETQPVPNPISYFAHQSPDVFHRAETLANHVIELLVPWFILLPIRSTSMITGASQILFQIVLIATGNLSFLNWLTILPSLLFFDDHFLARFHGQRTRKQLCAMNKECRNAGIQLNPRALLNLLVAGLIVYLSIPIVRNMASSRQVMNSSFDPLRLVNTYGAFGSVTKQRSEIVLMGTNSTNPDVPSALWLEYEFYCKPGNLTRTPCVISPYHYRLDWLMWFLQFQDYSHHPWLIHLMGKFLTEPQDVNSLIAYNPFGITPPKFIKAVEFKYSFTDFGAPGAVKGAWWRREYVRNYIPVISFGNIAPVYQQFGWRLPK